jgi:hypothetical protein
MAETDQPTDQDIDTAGTEADDTFQERHDQLPQPADPTQAPLGVAPDSDGEQRGSDHRTLHRAEDDNVAYARSPEFHDIDKRGS